MRLNLLLPEITKEIGFDNKTALKNILLLALCILRKGTVVLNKLKSDVGLVLENERTSPASNYRRLTRTVTKHSMSPVWLSLMQCVFSLLRLRTKYLILDGTNWYKGKFFHNYMVLSIVYKKVAIPIYWEPLKRKGTSSEEQRKTLLENALKHFDLTGKVLLADREYIGREWFKFLKSKGLDFAIRVTSNYYKNEINAAVGKSYDALCNKVIRSKCPNKALAKAFVLCGVPLIFVVSKNATTVSKKDLLLLITTLEEHPATVSKQYAIRWKIEHCFKQLKTNGFNLEDMNVQGFYKHRFIIAIVVFAYTLSVYFGLKEYKKVTIKKYRNGTAYKSESIFRFGQHLLLLKLSSFYHFLKLLHTLFNKNRNTYRSPYSFFVQ